MISRWRRSAMTRSRPVKCMARAAFRARSRERPVKSAIERFEIRGSRFEALRAVLDASREGEVVVEMVRAVEVGLEVSGSFDFGLRPSLRMTEFNSGRGMVTARDSGRRRRPLQRGQMVADMYCIMYSR